MIKCRVGLIAQPLNNPSLGYINLGEVFMNKNVENLYSIHVNTQYLTRFLALVKDNNITIDNIEEIYKVQEHHKLTRKIYPVGNLSGKLTFSRPKLYDISCMVPLFIDEIIHRKLPLSNAFIYRVFIVIPIYDPIIRGKAITNCINMNQDRKSLFYVLGEKFGSNKKATCMLTKRYLVENCGVEAGDVSCEMCHNIEEAVQNVCLQMFGEDIEIFIVTGSKNVGNIMNIIRNSHNNLGFVCKKIQLICE